MSFVLPLPGLAFIFHPLLCFPFAFPLFVLSLFTFFSHSSSCLYLCSGLKQRSLNHIRDRSSAKCHPLYRSSAALLSLFSWFFHILAFVSINPPLSSPLFLTLTQFSTPYSLSPHYICSFLRCYTRHPGLLSLKPPTLHSNFFFSLHYITNPCFPCLSLLIPTFCASHSGFLSPTFPSPGATASLPAIHPHTLPPSGSLSFQFCKVADIKRCFSNVPLTMSLLSSSHPCFFFFFSRNGWQPLTCSSLWTGLTPLETNSSRMPKCCAPTSMPSPISLWVAGKSCLKTWPLG